MSDQAFNAALCQSGSCAVSARRLLPRLKAVTRSCDHGVLIRSGCLLQARRCHAPGRDSGAYLVVQPCGTDRRPHGAAVTIGPVISDADAAAVTDWLTGGELDAAQLEPRLRLIVQPGL